MDSFENSCASPWRDILRSFIKQVKDRAAVFAFSCLPMLVAVVGIAALLPLRSQAQSCPNAIVCENALPGDTDWQIPDSGSNNIQGFTTDISVNVGQTVFFKVNTSASNYTLAIYRMGYYGGAGARKITTISPSASLPQTQPACLSDSTTGLVDCGNWAVSASWGVPANAVSGLYFALLRRSDTNEVSHVFWIVRNDASHSDVLYQTSDETWVAYNDYGGHSLYGGAGTFDLNNRAYKVSYNRPSHTRTFESFTFLFNAEYPMIRWLEANGYDVTYFTCIDAVRSGNLITNHKAYLSVGHDEYVSSERRTNLELARDAGVNLAFFSGNEMFWKTRWENSIDGSNTTLRTLVCFKESYFGTPITYKQDPNAPTWTGTWRDPRFSPPRDGGRPENRVTGTLFNVNGPGDDNRDLSIKVPAADGKMRFWRNTSIATQGAGQVATLPPGTLGYEWDSDVDNGYRPPGLVPMSAATYTLTQDLLKDYGGTYGGGSTTHRLTLYKAPSGALVFGAGTVQWSWGLDGNHDNGPGGQNGDVRMQQATVNLFADMSVQPASLQSGLSLATKSTDTAAPAVAISSPAPGASVQAGTAITVSGTATDSGGGVVGAVEVSVDGGQSWHPATGREQWTFQWTPWSSSTSASLSVRAADDSGNLSAAISGSYTITGTSGCPCSLWTNSTVPANPNGTDTTAIELGVQFRSDVAGCVSGVRFYKGTGNTGTHVGNLWTIQGSKLATVTFTNETASGWQQANFSSPVAIQANTPYIISYYSPTGRYSYDSGYFTDNSVISPPLRALAAGVDGPNALYRFGSGGGFPINTFKGENYWVDLVFITAVAPTWNISGTITPAATASGATIALSGGSTATTTANASGNYSFTGLANGSYTVTPSKTGYSFSPASANVTVNGANVTVPNFAISAVPTYSISGTVSPAASGSGATLNLTGTATATTTANASGNYTFSGLPNGNYTVTPAKAGFTATPVSRAVTVSSANVTGADFTLSAGVSIWSNTATPAVASDNDASAVELGLKFRSDSSGLVTAVRFYKGPQNTGVHVGHLWSNTGTNLATVTFSGETASGWQQMNFATPVAIAANTTYIISYYAPNGGYAVNPAAFASAGVDNVPLHALANGVDGGNGVYVYGSGGGYPNNTYNSTNYWVDVVFTAQATYSISGTINGGAASTVTLSGSGNATVTADGSGNYTFNGLVNGTYTVTPSKTGLVFTPANASTTVSGANVTGLNFTASAAPTWTISGAITPAVSGSGTTVALSGAAAASTTANASGNFNFSGLANGNYVVTPSKTGFVFNPASANVTVNGANVTVPNFTISAVATYSISGTLSPAGSGSGATLNLTGGATASTTADGSGNYTFSGLVNGTYTVTPSKAGFAFTPVNRAVTISGTSATAINFSVSAGISIWNSTATPATVSVNDPSAVELGLKFRSDTAGTVTAVRFYKGSTNTGVHVGNLWSSTGTKLGTVTFSGETASGWQQMNFASPISIAANTTYVISYYAPSGRYSANSAAFASTGVDNAPLHALSNSAGSGNGVYRYGAGGGFPNSTFNSTNYWVDLVFTVP